MTIDALPDRIRSKIRIDEAGHWIWTAALDRRGYGVVSWDGLAKRAHRVVFTLLVGDPGTLDLDHLCRVPACVNPNDLEPVTHRTNVLRGQAPSAVSVRTNRCKRGHEFTPENTMTRIRGDRSCRACHNLRRRRTAVNDG